MTDAGDLHRPRAEALGDRAGGCRVGRPTRDRDTAQAARHERSGNCGAGAAGPHEGEGPLGWTVHVNLFVPAPVRGAGLLGQRQC